LRHQPTASFFFKDLQLHKPMQLKASNNHKHMLPTAYILAHQWLALVGGLHGGPSLWRLHTFHQQFSFTSTLGVSGGPAWGPRSGDRTLPKALQAPCGKKAHRHNLLSQFMRLTLRKHTHTHCTYTHMCVRTHTQMLFFKLSMRLAARTFLVPSVSSCNRAPHNANKIEPRYLYSGSKVPLCTSLFGAGIYCSAVFAGLEGGGSKQLVRWKGWVAWEAVNVCG